MKPTEVVHGQPSWSLAAEGVRLYVTERGGHVGPVVFAVEGRAVAPYAVAPYAVAPSAVAPYAVAPYAVAPYAVAPYAVAPWAEAPPPDVPAVLQVLRGDFFCLPFGANDEPFRGERYPPHGETAGARWRAVARRAMGPVHTLHLQLDLHVRPGRVDKHVALVEGHTAVYQRHVVRGMAGPMTIGHHPTLCLPEAPGSGLVATSPFRRGFVVPRPFEEPAEGGFSALRPGASFAALEAVPTAAGAPADLSRYPARRGFEDLVLLATEPAPPWAWAAVTVPSEGYVWFSLRDARVLRHTLLWHSNGGRRYAPWDGRHVSRLGVEAVTAYFHYGLARSAEPNPLSEAGFPTHLDLEAAAPLDVRFVTAVAAVPSGFDHVAAVEPAGAAAVRLTARSGLTVVVPLWHGFVQGGALSPAA